MLSFPEECQIYSKDRYASLSCHLESQHPKVKQTSQGVYHSILRQPGSVCPCAKSAGLEAGLKNEVYRHS